MDKDYALSCLTPQCHNPSTLDLWSLRNRSRREFWEKTSQVLSQSHLKEEKPTEEISWNRIQGGCSVSIQVARKWAEKDSASLSPGAPNPRQPTHPWIEGRIEERRTKKKCTPKKCLREMNKMSWERWGTLFPESPQFNWILEFIESIECTKHWVYDGALTCSLRRKDTSGGEFRPSPAPFLVEVWLPYFLLAPLFSEGFHHIWLLSFAPNQQQRWATIQVVSFWTRVTNCPNLPETVLILTLPDLSPGQIGQLARLTFLVNT